MGKRRGGDETRIDCDAVDRDQDWQAIYAKLRADIGDHHAYIWFGHCRYLSCHGGMIRLEHWCAWGAREALNRHGMALCKAAGVSKALIRYNGGTVPKDCAARKVDGHADYVVPQQIAASTAEYRRKFVESTLGGL